jgi:hypothetical protein
MAAVAKKATANHRTLAFMVYRWVESRLRSNSWSKKLNAGNQILASPVSLL